VDFGASIFAREGRKRDTNLLGTPGYAAPEQYGYAPSSPGTDVYGLGMVFYEMVGRSREKDVPVRLRIVMKKATSALPENRFRNAGELKTALLSCLSPHLVLTFLAGEHYRRFINRIHKRKEKKKK
jgi:serine/threonine protein kinase